MFNKYNYEICIDSNNYDDTLCLLTTMKILEMKKNNKFVIEGISKMEIIDTINYYYNRVNILLEIVNYNFLNNDHYKKFLTIINLLKKNIIYKYNKFSIYSCINIIIKSNSNIIDNNFLSVIHNNSTVMMNLSQSNILKINDNFMRCSDIKEIILPKSILYICDGFCSYSKNLRQINLSSCANLLEIGDKFLASSNIKSLILPPSLQKIGDYFLVSSKIELLILPASLQIIGDYFCNETKDLIEIDMGKCINLLNVGLKCLFKSSVYNIICPPSKKLLEKIKIMF